MKSSNHFEANGKFKNRKNEIERGKKKWKKIIEKIIELNQKCDYIKIQCEIERAESAKRLSNPKAEFCLYIQL